MQRLRVPVYYDFASTLCYVAHRVMQRVAEALDGHAVELVWRPIDLSGITGWPRGAPVDGRRRDNVARVARELDVSVRLPSHWPDSRAAAAVALALAGEPAEPAWRERVFSALHEEGRNLDEPGSLAALAADLRLDLDALLTPDARAALELETDHARESEVTGVPTFMLDEWPIGGIQHETTMESMLCRWATRRRERAPERG